MMSTSHITAEFAGPPFTFSFSAIARKTFAFPCLLGVVLAVCAIFVASANLPDPDMWSHVAIGRQILDNYSLPVADTYSVTVRGSESLALEWLGEVAIALAARNGIVGMLTLLASLSATLILLLYYFVCQRCGNSKAAFLSCFLTLPLTTAFFTLRPQLFGYIFLIATMICLEAFRKGQLKSLWILPPLFVLWVNTHGSFILGLMVVALYWASGLTNFQVGGIRAVRWTDAQRFHLETVSIVSLAALAATPYGTRLAGSTLHAIFNARLGMANITEYPALGASGQLLQITLALALPFLLLHFMVRSSYRVEEIALLLAAFYGACMHSPLLVLFAIAFAPLLAVMLSRWIEPYRARTDRPALNFAMMLLFVTVLLRLLPSRNDLGTAIEAKFPIRAVAYLRAHPVSGTMFNDYGWGGYMMLGTPGKVFIDGRSQLYEDAGVYSDYLRIMSLDSATLNLLRKYDVQACLIRRDSPLATLLATQRDWLTIYSDSLSVVVVHRRHSPSAKGDSLPSFLRPPAAFAG